MLTINQSVNDVSFTQINQISKTIVLTSLEIIITDFLIE